MSLYQPAPDELCYALTNEEAKLIGLHSEFRDPNGAPMYIRVDLKAA